MRTVANAMDVGAPSNFERIEWLYGGDREALRRDVDGYSCDDASILSLIAEQKLRYGYLSDPHSAVGYGAAKTLDVDGFWVSTAHAAKFGDALRRLRALRRRCRRPSPRPCAVNAIRHLWRPMPTP